ncbi:MAG TPA: hypothetical protein VH327_03255 [Gammaproteobacteria bacterium]|nr:hypothetical protein [Gammaproteobacteria bacterium]
MRISTRFTQRVMLAAGVTLCATAAQAAAHSYIPFTESLNSGGSQSIWLADVDHLGNPPYQLSNQVLDGNGAIAVLDDWTLDPITHLATGVTPQLVVWGTGGHLYKANLRSIQPVQQFSNGGYGELCSLAALDERPYAAAKAYVQAVVEPTGSVNDCASGIGTQTWLIPANADNSVAPILEPTHWSVLGAFTDPTDGSFVRWIVWTGNEVDAYKANFTTHTTLLVGPPTGPAPAVFGRQDGNALMVSAADDGVTHTDRLYHLSMAGSGLVSTFSYPDAAPCPAIGGVGGSVVDTATGVVAFSESTATGYAIYAAPLSGAAPVTAYSEASGSKCGSIGGDTVSGSFAGVVETDSISGGTRVLGVNEAGPANQAPNVLVNTGANVSPSIRYTIDGHFWIPVLDFTGPTTAFTTVVADGNGTVLQSYSNSRVGDDIWHGFGTNAPIIERDVVYLFSPNATHCTGGVLTAVDPAAFTGTVISGVPADACTTLAYGWQPASVGYVQEAGGSSAVEIDPVGGKLYQLLGTDPNGFFTNLATLTGYPFY